MSAHRPALVATLLIVAACRGQFEVPVPVLAAPPTPPPPQERATIAIPVQIALARVVSELGTAFPPADSLDRIKCAALGGVVCHQYVYRRDTLVVRMVGDRVSVYTRLGFRGRVSLPGVGGIASCGYAPEPMQRAELRLSTTLYWRSDWRLASRGTILAPELRDRCQVTFARVDATPLMRRLVEGQLASLQRSVDSVIPAATDLRPAADSLWRIMATPVALDSAGSVWLAMSPEGASLAPLAGANGGNAVATSIQLTARPRIVVGAKPAADDARPLPSLTLAPRNASGLHVPVQIEVPFDELSRHATEAMSGEAAGKGLRVDRVTVWGVGDTAVVKVELEGRVNGALYLLGRVAYDQAARTVLLNDLRYTLASRDAMSRVRATLGAGRIKKAVDDATGHGRLNVGDRLDALRDQLGAELNRTLAPGVSLSGSLRDFRIESFYTTSSAFVLRVTLDGDARIAVQ